MNKEKRLDAIRKILTSSHIRSQDELLSRLIDLGFDITQATLSRDLKQLKVGRVPTDKGFTYVISDEVVNKSDSRFSPIAHGFMAIEFSGNLAVIKTLPAYSHTIADAIDKSEMNEVLGTVAGNDTVIAVLREGCTPNQVVEALIKALPELKDKL